MLVIEPSPGQLSGDAGLLPVRPFDKHFGLTRAFAEALDDPRDHGLTAHTFLEMVRSRVYGILAGYADQNDHDTLRHDPVFKLVADRYPEDDDLAGQPTLSRCHRSSARAHLVTLATRWKSAGRPLTAATFRSFRGLYSFQRARFPVQNTPHRAGTNQR
jgi:hypothetical protein